MYAVYKLYKHVYTCALKMPTTFTFLSKYNPTTNPTLDPVALPPFHLDPKKR